MKTTKLSNQRYTGENAHLRSRRKTTGLRGSLYTRQVCVYLENEIVSEFLHTLLR